VEDPDLPTLLAEAVVRLADGTGCERVTIWGRGSDGTPTVVAASLEGPGSLSPSEDVLAALEALERVTDLGSEGVARPLAKLAERDGLAAAAPLSTGSHGAVAFLLAGGSRDPVGGVRPRTLAALESAARRLALPVAAALATRRLARLDAEVRRLDRLATLGSLTDAEVRRLDRLATLGSLTAEIVHEIRNPLVSLKTFAELLPERADDPEFRRSFSELAREELRRVERLLDLVLEQARPARESSEEESSPASAIHAVSRLLARRATLAEIELELEVPENLPSVRLDQDALRQVVLNLLQNAIEASPLRSRVRIGARRAGGSVVVEVADEGPGVPDELRVRIFEPFVSTRQSGSGGLGLAISRRIVDEAGGGITLLDAPEGGSVFRVELPVAAPASHPGGDPPAR
jgi:signal transduction histidine kinase